MFERFTERARRALFFARVEVTQLGGVSIETEHLLLAQARHERPDAHTLEAKRCSAEIFQAGRRGNRSLVLASSSRRTSGVGVGHHSDQRAPEPLRNPDHHERSFRLKMNTDSGGC